MPHVRDISAAEFADAVVARSKEVPVVVDFWATWCGPCRVLSPLLERLATDANGEWELVKIDVDQNQQLAMEFGVQGIPTIVGFRDGEPIDRFTGALPEASIKEWLRRIVPTAADRAASEAKTLAEAGQTEEAETLFRRVLDSDPDHHGAITGLAAVLIDDDRSEEASRVLARLPETGEVHRLQSIARTRKGAGDLDQLRERVEKAPEDWQARLALGRTLAANGHHREALEQLLAIVQARDPDHSDDARQAMVDMFEVMDDPETVSEYRRRLANSLF